jgi:hypothetical protein
MSKFIVAVAALGVALAANPALAKKKAADKKFVVLVRLEPTVPAAWEKEIQDVAQMAAMQKDGLEWMAPPQVSLEESRTLLGCQSYDANCIAQIADTLGAARALYVEITAKEGKPTMLGLVAVTVKTPNKSQWRQVELPDVDVAGLAATKAFVRGEVLEQPATVLVVTSDVVGASITIDGKPAGVTPLTIEDAKIGSHDVQVEKAGYQPVMRRVEVQKGRLVHLQVPLPAIAVAVAPPPVLPPKPKVVEAVVAKPLPAVKPVAKVAPATPPIKKAAAGKYPHWDSPVAWVGVGLGAAGLIAAGALYGVHLSIGLNAQNHLFKNDNPPPAWTSDVTQQTMNSWRGQMTGTYIGAIASLAVGAVLIGTGSAFFFLPPE